MSLNIKNKRSAVLGSAPTPAQLEDGEIGVNYNAADPALYVKDSAGAVIRLAGEGAVGAGQWEQVGNDLYPKVATSDVKIGGTLPGTPNIELKASGTAEFGAGAVTINSNGLNTAGNPNGGSADGIRAFSSGYFMASRSASSPIFTGYTTGTSQTKVVILADGSATFTGDLTIDKSPASGQVGATIDLGSVLNETLGEINVERVDGSYKSRLNFKTHANNAGTLETALTIDQNKNVLIGGTLPSSPNIELNSDGSAAFAGSVSIGGTAAANTIDAYEEGTSTVDLTVGGVAAGLTGTNAQGTYTRIGNIVTVQVNLNISSASVSGLTGNLAITGLPFASANNTRSNYATAACSIINWATEYADGSKTILATNAANSTSLSLFAGSRSSTSLDETAFDFTNGTCRLYVTFTYRIS